MIRCSFTRSETIGGGDSAGIARRRQRRGIAATEFAVLAPFLVALVMGMGEMGRLVMVKETLTNAARKGCRTGVTVGKSYQNLLDDVNNILTDNGFPSADATITVQIAPYTGTSTKPSWGSFTTVMNGSSFTPNALDKVSVQVSLPVADALWFSPQFMPSTSVVSESLIMLKQG